MRGAMRRCLLATAVLGLVVGATGRAEADLIVDQQFGPPPGNRSFDILALSPLGQSFTPSLAGVDFATFDFVDFSGATGAATYKAELHSGINGTLLGTSAAVTLPSGFGGVTGAPVEFDFASTIPLTPGETYSLMLVKVDGSGDFLAFGNNPGGYAGGVSVVGGQTFTNGDLFFSEGLRVAAAPEPSSALVAGFGVLAGLGAWARRRRRRLALLG